MDKLKVLAITQARIGSTRFPEKILKTIQGKSLLELHLERLLLSRKIHKLKIATTNEVKVNNIIEIGKKCGVSSYQGSVNNVLDRFYQAAKDEQADYIVRLTSDCPLIDARLVDEVIDFTIENNLDFCSNAMEQVFPDGQDVAVFRFDALREAWEQATLPSEKEHVTPYIVKNSTYRGGRLFRSQPYLSNKNYNHVRLTVDEPEDLAVIKALIRELGFWANWQDYTNLYINSGISKINKNIIRNEGYLKSLKKEKDG